MLRDSLYKRFGTKKFQDAGKVDKPTEEVFSIPTIEDLKKNLQVKSFLGSPLNGYTTTEQPEGTISTTEASYAPGTFSADTKVPIFTPFSSPFNIYDVNKNTPAVEQGPMTKAESDYFTFDNTTTSTTPDAKENNIPAMVSLGLLGADTLLSYNQDLKNTRKRNESIQQRNSKPLYDYNYMYGRTTSGGTEYQPVIKAEMGAQINKRYASNGATDVEIEGGEFIQLPNLDTEMAEGPSHENGGISTNLPDQTRVYSNNLKPEGSKKTFAQIAKNYDTTSYRKTLENPFAKQVDKDTASLMMQRNQKILDDLFKDQQAMNGNSNGETMSKGGINNPGFKALPGYVQAKITANMATGGDVDNPEDLPRVKAIDPLNLAANTNVSQLEAQYTVDQANEAASIAARSKNALFDPTKPPMPAHTGPEAQFLQKLDPTLNPSLEMVPGVQTSLGTGVYGDESNLDIFNNNYRWYLDDLAASGETFDPRRPGDVRRAQVAYTEEAYNRFRKQGLSESEARQKADEVGFVATKSLQNSVDDMLGKYTATRILPENKTVPPTPVTPGEKPPMELLDVPPTQGTPPTKPVTPINPITGKTFQGVSTPEKGKYIPGEFPLYQAIPEAMGLAQAQEIYPYAIPEINAPYVRPQTLNIQSQLQDIDSMATATQRAGGDPLTTYIAGLDAKQKAFQAKQNYDAEGRSRADMANAQMRMSADQINSQYFNQVYNNMVGQARDAQSAEKQAAIASAVNKKAKFTQDETKKAAYINALMENYDVDSKGNFTLKPGKNPIINSNITTKAKKGMYKK